MDRAANKRTVDIHCHLLHGIDDGASSLQVSLDMARLAVHDGIDTIIVTPHQLGNFSHNSGAAIRRATQQMQACLQRQRIPLRLLPGADVRIETNLTRLLTSGEVLTLADRGKHVLLELPHELYFPLQPLLQDLATIGIVGILSHPERNQGLLCQRGLVPQLVDAGCLMQITAGSLSGTFGPQSQEFSQWMLAHGLVHFVATDAHGSESRRPLLRRAYDQVRTLTDQATANDRCVVFPRSVADGRAVPPGRRSVLARKSRGWFAWKTTG